VEVTEDMLNLVAGLERSSLQTTVWGLQPSYGPCHRSGGAKLNISLVFFRRYAWRFAVETKPPHEEEQLLSRLGEFLKQKSFFR